MAGSAARAELRTFGLTVGTAFVLFGTISWWRGHEIPPKILWALGASLLVPGLLFPGTLGPVQRGWMAFAAVLGHVNTRMILTVLFYVVITPVGLVMRLFRDPLDRALDDGRASHWVKREREPVEPTRYERQF
ncbi:MAG: sxtJ [Deltaproteobacteria bacterium]|nr:sxtJ [Deltaproteobacteria bacterium]